MFKVDVLILVNNHTFYELFYVGINYYNLVNLIVSLIWKNVYTNELQFWVVSHLLRNYRVLFETNFESRNPSASNVDLQQSKLTQRQRRKKITTRKRWQIVCVHWRWRQFLTVFCNYKASKLLNNVERMIFSVTKSTESVQRSRNCTMNSFNRVNTTYVWRSKWLPCKML